MENPPFLDDFPFSPMAIPPTFNIYSTPSLGSPTNAQTRPGYCSWQIIGKYMGNPIEIEVYPLVN